MHLKRMCILCCLFAFGYYVLKISIKSICSVVSFWFSVALLIFYLEDLSLDVSGVLKSPTIIVFPSASPFMSINIYFMYLGAPMLDLDQCKTLFLY